MVTDVQARIAALSPEQRAMLEQRLADLVAARGPGMEGPITPRDRSQPTPLAIQQQREWTLSQVSANIIPGAFRVEGELDLELLSRVLTDVVEQHETLRSTVETTQEGSRVQVVHPPAPVPVPMVDLSQLTDQQQRAELHRRWQAEVETPFDPRQQLRLRICLVRLGEQTHVVFITTDHAAADLVSVGLLVEEFAARYGIHRSGGAGGLEPLEIQYGDYAAWQRAVEEQRLAAELEHWRKALDGIPAGLALPADRPYPVRPAFTGGTHATALSPELSAGLRQVGDRAGVSLGILLTAASAVLLYRYTRRDDIVIGEVVSGRNKAELQRLIGCFVGALPMRMRLTGEQPLAEVVRQARDTVMTAYDHQDLPVDGLLDQLDLDGDTSLASLIDIWLSVRTPETLLEVPGLRISVEAIDSALALSPLTLDADPNSDPLRLYWIYMTEMFDAGTVALLADQFLRILDQLVTSPDTPVGEVALAAAPAAERPSPAGGAAASTTVVELFERRAALAPYAPAAVRDGVATSYGELNRAANEVARRLRERGVGRDTPVGVLVSRSPRLAAAILGVLKAGGYYLPLDPDHPSERIAGMLADAGVRVLVTEEPLADLVPAAPAGTVLVDRLDGAGTDPPEAPVAPDPDSLAYAVYTSGSTGRPKGAMIAHRSLVAYAREVVDRLGLGAGDRFLQFASPSFDVLVEELFPTWLAGGCVVFPTRPLLDSGEDLADLIERERLTVIELPTAYWHEWVRELDRHGRELASCLRLVIIGGEPVLPDRLATWRRFGVPLMNCYGLTETTVTSTFFLLDPADPAVEWPNFPIGTPLPLADLRVLDDRLRPVPLGATGELYIGGISVGHGYVGQPGLTAHRFVADPAQPSQRLYRTGDLVRQRADGAFEFISRVDRQVKVRGFRVEPTEIESTLSRHPRVAETVVSTYEPTPGDRRLVGYVVGGPGGAPSAAELRQFLEANLPAYLVPSAFVELAALPLSSNGKVAHDRLPAPQPLGAEALEYVAPTTPVEQQLAGIVAAVMGVDRVGVQENFFEIGGDSILAIQVVARAQEGGLRLSPLDLFANPTIAALAEVASAGPAVDAEQADVTGPVPVAPGLRWLSGAGLADPHHWNRSALLELPAPVEPAVVDSAVQRLLAHHDGLRQRILLAGERTRVRIAPRGDATPLSTYDLTGLEPDQRALRLAEIGAEIHASLDLAVGPLVRVALIKLDGQPDRLAIAAHRTAVDAASLRILVDDLRSTLTQLASGAAVTLPPKTTSWQAWVRRLVAYAATPQVQAQRAYWSDLAATAGGALPADLPVEPAADVVASERAVTAALDAGETADLLAVTEPLHCRIEEILLAALGRVLHGWSEADPHLVDIEHHDRVQVFEDVDLSRTVGWFSYTHPALLPGNGTPEVTLQAVKEALRAVPAAGTGWELLHLGPEPVAPSPAEVAFTYLGESVPDQAGDWWGPERSPRQRRPYPIEVAAWLTDAALTVRWRYSQHRHRDRTLQRLAGRYLDELRAMIQLGAHRSEVAWTPSDFPLARVDQAQLDNLLSRL